MKANVRALAVCVCAWVCVGGRGVHTPDVGGVALATFELGLFEYVMSLGGGYAARKTHIHKHTKAQAIGKTRFAASCPSTPMFRPLQLRFADVSVFAVVCRSAQAA